MPNEEQKPTGNHDIPLLQTVTQLDENEIPKDTQCFIMGKFVKIHNFLGNAQG